MEVRREVDLEAAPEDVWMLLTDPDELTSWFEADVELDPRPGGSGRFSGAGTGEREAQVDEVEEDRRLAFRWWPVAGDGTPSRVEFVLIPIAGGTRLVVTETLGVHASIAAWTWRLDLLSLQTGARAFA